MNAPTHQAQTESRLARTFLAVDRRVDQALKGLAAIHRGLWLGFMDRASLHHVTGLAYQELPTYRAEGHNRAGLFDWEERAIRKYFSRCSHVLVGAAGGGREVFALSRAGYRVDAFEPSAELCETCAALLRQERVDARVQRSAPDEVPEALVGYDGLIVGWTAYSHIAGRGTRIEFLRQCRSHLRSGGPILISFWIRDANERPLRWIHGIAQFIRRLRRSPDTVEPGDSLERFFVHRFIEDEIRRELEEAGFRVIHYSQQDFGHAIGEATAPTKPEEPAEPTAE